MNNNLNYIEKDGVLYPELTSPKIDNLLLGKYGEMRLDYIKKFRKGTYTTLLTEGELSSHLAEVDKSARKQVKAIIDALAIQNCCNEDLKATKQLLWVQMMNGYKSSAEEIVLNELVYS